MGNNRLHGLLGCSRYGKHCSIHHQDKFHWDLMIMTRVVFVAGLAFMFPEGGGKIQNIVIEKHNTRYVRSATIIDAVYWLILCSPKN